MSMIPGGKLLAYVLEAVDLMRWLASRMNPESTLSELLAVPPTRLAETISEVASASLALQWCSNLPRGAASRLLLDGLWHHHHNVTGAPILFSSGHNHTKCTLVGSVALAGKGRAESVVGVDVRLPGCRTAVPLA